MRVLLLQFRPDAEIATHEFNLVVRYSGRMPEEFVRVDATSVAVTPALLEGIDAVILGGSGDYLISRGDIPDILTATSELLFEARRRGIPTLGICFGGQILTHAFGGRVELDESRAEVGTFAVTRTEAGKDDPLFSDLPDTFDAQLGHKDHLVVLPKGAVHLASSERSTHQVWRFPSEPFYALTFHPELDMDAVLYRVGYYANEYKLSGKTLEKMRAVLRPSPEASTIIARFLRTFVGVDNVVENTVE